MLTERDAAVGLALKAMRVALPKFFRDACEIADKAGLTTTFVPRPTRTDADSAHSNATPLTYPGNRTVASGSAAAEQSDVACDDAYWLEDDPMLIPTTLAVVQHSVIDSSTQSSASTNTRRVQRLQLSPPYRLAARRHYVMKELLKKLVLMIVTMIEIDAPHPAPHDAELLLQVIIFSSKPYDDLFDFIKIVI